MRHLIPLLPNFKKAWEMFSTKQNYSKNLEAKKKESKLMVKFEAFL